MLRSLQNLIQRRLLWLSLLLALWLLCSGQAWAGPLADRLDHFPNWTNKPLVQVANGDLIYPNWMAGTWHLTTTLVDLAAPLAPTVVTPGFEGNRALLNRPVECRVRFISQPQVENNSVPVSQRTQQIVADRAFNSLNLVTAYLGAEAVRAVRVDPQNPNRQVTILRGNRTLESTVTARGVEVPQAGTFITSEVLQQVFRGTAQPLFNEVEITTIYHKPMIDQPIIEADQVTAIYLSPQDPNYFKAWNRPVALYRYQLRLSPAMSAPATLGQT